MYNENKYFHYTRRCIIKYLFLLYKKMYNEKYIFTHNKNICFHYTHPLNNKYYYTSSCIINTFSYIKKYLLLLYIVLYNNNKYYHYTSSHTTHKNIY